MIAPGTLEHITGELAEAKANAKAWRRHSAWLASGFAVVLIYALFVSLTKRVEVHITEVDSEARILWAGLPNSKYSLDDLKMLTTAQDWIEDCRSRPDDPVVAQKWRQSCLNKAEGKAFEQMKLAFARLAAQAKDASQQDQRVRVKVKNFVRQKEGKYLYRLRWIETISPLYGQGAQDVKMSALITMQLRNTQKAYTPMLTVGDERKSHLGIYISDVVFSTTEDLPNDRSVHRDLQPAPPDGVRLQP